MRRIIITDYVDTVTLLRDLEISIFPKEISRKAEMASGKTVKDVVGYKDVISLPVGYLSLSDNEKILNMITRNSGLLTISYPTPTGDMTNQFIVNPPTFTTFAYDDNGVAIWQGVTISGETVEVVR